MNLHATKKVLLVVGVTLLLCSAFVFFVLENRAQERFLKTFGALAYTELFSGRIGISGVPDAYCEYTHFSTEGDSEVVSGYAQSYKNGTLYTFTLKQEERSVPVRFKIIDGTTLVTEVDTEAGMRVLTQSFSDYTSSTTELCAASRSCRKLLRSPSEPAFEFSERSKLNCTLGYLPPEAPLSIESPGVEPLSTEEQHNLCSVCTELEPGAQRAQCGLIFGCLPR